MKLTKWTNAEILETIDEFDSLYKKRPIIDNHGGMKSAHMLSAWFVVKKLKPKYLIESGIWKGLGTWFFQSVSPETKIFSIDPRLDLREYISEKVNYQTKDFLDTDWKSILDPKETLVFFDDHQNFAPRIKKCKELGFTKVMWEDNYPCNQGDCYTPKKILANKKYVIDRAGDKNWFEANNEDLDYFKSNVSTYQEMPPIFKDSTTRWGDAWDEQYPTPDPLLTNENQDKYKQFFEERKDYTWMAYMELNEGDS